MRSSGATHRSRPSDDGERAQTVSRLVEFASRYLAWLPLLLVVLSLVGLVLTPLVLRQRTKTMRSDFRSVAEPARLLLGELRLGLARELSLAQRFAITPENSTWMAYHRATASDDSVLARLEITLATIGPGALVSVADLKEAVKRWRQLAAMDEGKAPGDFLRQSIQRGVTFEGLLQSTLGVDTAVSRAMQMRRARIDAAESFQVNLAIAFVAIGCLASAAVLVLTLRGRHLRNLLRRRAEEETLLRRLAGELSGAFTIRDVAELAVKAAEQSSRIAGAFLAKAVDGHLILLSGRGSYASFGGTRTPIPSWLNGGRHAEHPRVYTTEVRAPHARVNHGRPRRSLLVVPLRHEGELIGTFGISSAGGRRRFNASALRFGQALGDLTAVALHRAEALEREQTARAEAEAAVRTRDAVVSIVSHDLRNPLTAIIGNVDYLLEVLRGVPGLEKERTQLITMKHAADAMNRLIRDLLDVTRLESGPLPIHRKRLDLAEIVDDVLGMFQPVARTRRLTLERENVASVPIVSGDRDRLAQCLWNLVGNAVKFTPDGGRVSIKIEPHADGVRVCVCDSGPGIAPEDVPHLFDRFWQASRRDGRGLGLGLFIVKAIVEAHGGSVQVETAPQRGSKFCFVIPGANDELPASSRSDGASHATRQLVAVATEGRHAPKVETDGRGAPKVPSPPLVPEVKVQEKHQEH